MSKRRMSRAEWLELKRLKDKIRGRPPAPAPPELRSVTRFESRNSAPPDGFAAAMAMMAAIIMRGTMRRRKT